MFPLDMLTQNEAIATLYKQCSNISSLFCLEKRGELMAKRPAANLHLRSLEIMSRSLENLYPKHSDSDGKLWAGDRILDDLKDLNRRT